MAVDHKTIVDAERHEPKGASTAASGTVYTSNGAGSGSWTNPTSSIKNANQLTLNVTIPDISTAGSVFVACPIAGVISKVYVTIFGAITVADAIVTGKINGVAIGGLSITCAFTGSAAGTVFNGTPSSANTLTAGQAVEILTDGGSTTTVSAQVTILVNTA